MFVLWLLGVRDNNGIGLCRDVVMWCWALGRKAPHTMTRRSPAAARRPNAPGPAQPQSPRTTCDGHMRHHAMPRPTCRLRDWSPRRTRCS